MLLSSFLLFMKPWKRRIWGWISFTRMNLPSDIVGRWSPKSGCCCLKESECPGLWSNSQLTYFAMQWKLKKYKTMPTVPRSVFLQPSGLLRLHCRLLLPVVSVKRFSQPSDREKDVRWAYYNCDVALIQEGGKQIIWDSHRSESGWAFWLDRVRTGIGNAVPKWWPPLPAKGPSENERVGAGRHNRMVRYQMISSNSPYDFQSRCLLAIQMPKNIG